MKAYFQNCVLTSRKATFSIRNEWLTLCTIQPFFFQKGKASSRIVIALALLLFATGCKDPYEVKVPPTQQSVLVVEGFLNSEGETSIKLSRSKGLNDASSVSVEGGASVVVETGSVQYQLTENSPGTYRADLGVLNPSAEYRLHINTANGREYVSDYVKPKSTPAIDSISWARDSKGVTVYASTHDATNSSLYYKYDYEETWETHARYVSQYLYDPVTGSFTKRDPADVPYECWKSRPSVNINLATSTALENDVISQKPLAFIPNGDEKLNVRYSILVKQYVLSKDAYEFFQLIKKNTESVGTVFDPQPSEITGNIRAISGSETVIGFFYASSEQQKRIFIAASEVPGWNYDYQCTSEYIQPSELSKAVGSGLYPYNADVSFSMITAYYVSVPRCYDCTVTGGSRTKPLFW